MFTIAPSPDSFTIAYKKASMFNYIPILDRHVFTEWLKAFLICLGLTVGLILLEDMYNDLPELIELGAKAPAILQYYALLLPSFLPLIFPLAFLASVLYSLGVLHRNHEITAMRASGLHVLRITRSLWGVGVLLGGLLFYLNAYLIPQSVEGARSFYEGLSFSHQSKQNAKERVGLIYNLSFYNQLDQRLWFFNRFSQYTQSGYGLSLYIQDKAGKELQRILAKEASFDAATDTWIFKEGRELHFDPLSEEPIYSKYFLEKKQTGFSESPYLMEASQKPIQDLSQRELKLLLHYSPPELKSPQALAYEMAKHNNLAHPFSCIVILAVGIPFTISSVRSNPLIGMSKTVALVFIYYFLLMVCTRLGEAALLPILLAAWLPMLSMLILSSRLYKSL